MKEYEKTEKYMGLDRELKKLWNMCVTVMPIVVGERNWDNGDKEKNQDYTFLSIVKID